MSAGEDPVAARGASPFQRWLFALAIGPIALLLVAVACSSTATTDATPSNPGQLIASQKGCTACHSSDGTRRAGPTWSGLYGSSVELADGRTVTADDRYVRESITRPSEAVVDGYVASMPTSTLTADEVDQILGYIKSLGSADSSHPSGDTSTGSTSPNAAP